MVSNFISISVLRGYNDYPEPERILYLLLLKVLNIGYQNRIGWECFISDIGYRGRYRRYARISGVHIGHYI